MRRTRALLLGAFIASLAMPVAVATTVTPGIDGTQGDVGPGYLDSTTGQLWCSQDNGVSVKLPAQVAPTLWPACSMVQVVASDICSNTANGIPCLDSNTKLSTAVVANTLQGVSGIGFATGTNTSSSTQTASATSSNTSTASGTGTLPTTQTASFTASGTKTLTQSGTITITATTSLTATVTDTTGATGIATGTATATYTATAIGTQTLVGIRTNAGTSTFTFTATGTGSGTTTASGSATLTGTTTDTSTSYATVTTATIASNPTITYNPPLTIVPGGDVFLTYGYDTIFTVSMGFFNAPYVDEIALGGPGVDPTAAPTVGVPQDFSGCESHDHSCDVLDVLPYGGTSPVRWISEGSIQIWLWAKTTGTAEVHLTFDTCHNGNMSGASVLGPVIFGVSSSSWQRLYAAMPLTNGLLVIPNYQFCVKMTAYTASGTPTVTIGATYPHLSRINGPWM